MELLVYDMQSAAPLVYRYLLPEEVDVLDRELNSIEEVEDEDGETVIEHDSDVIESIVRMVELAPILGGKCPYRSVSRDLEQLPAWNYQQLENYVSQRLMG